MTTMNLTDALDLLVRELKLHPETDKVKFIHAGKASAAPNPLENFVAACSVKSFSADSTKGVQGKLLFTLYAPKGCHLRELCELSVIIAALVDESTLRDRISSIACMEATFDEGGLIWRQNIEVEVSADMGEITAEIQGSGSVVLREFEELSKACRYEIRELMSGAVDCLEQEKKNTLKLTFVGRFEFGTQPFDLHLPSLGAVYEGCRVVEESCRRSGGKSVYGAVLEFAQKGSIEEEQG